MTASIDLVALSGPLEGSRIELRPDRPLLIGRSFRGVHLADPLVSIEHAEIAWVTDYYWVSDLGSLTGTFLDGERLANDAKPLVPGAILRIGESDFRVVVRRGWPPWAVPLLALLVVLGTVALVLIMRAAKVEVYDPWLHMPEPVYTGQGEPVTLPDGSGRLDVPMAFIREYGADHRHLDLRYQDDYDEDGRTDFWLRWRGTEGMFTFDDDGGWRKLGSFPIDCTPRQEMPFPELRCDRGGDFWRLEGGEYHHFGQEGVVVWVRLAEDADGGGGPVPSLPVPFRVTLQDLPRLAGFLQDRGVVAPVHYLICEQAIDGARAQVLTGFDVIEPLEYGCISDLNLVVQTAESDLLGAKPVAVAFTATGRSALLRDLAQHLFGDDEGLFRQVEARQLLPHRVSGRNEAYQSFAAVPQWSPQTRLVFTGIELHVDSLAAEEAREAEWSDLVFSSRGIPASPPVKTEHVPTFGEDLLLVPDEGQCEVYRISTRDMAQCARRRWCRPGKWFLRIDEVGCTEDAVPVIEVPYEVDLEYVRTPRHEIAVRLDREFNTNFIDVLRARVAVRETFDPPPPPPLEEPDLR